MVDPLRHGRLLIALLLLDEVGAAVERKSEEVDGEAHADDGQARVHEEPVEHREDQLDKVDERGDDDVVQDSEHRRATYWGVFAQSYIVYAYPRYLRLHTQHFYDSG